MTIQVKNYCKCFLRHKFSVVYYMEAKIVLRDFYHLNCNLHTLCRGNGKRTEVIAEGADTAIISCKIDPNNFISVWAAKWYFEKWIYFFLLLCFERFIWLHITSVKWMMNSAVSQDLSFMLCLTCSSPF